MGWFTGQGLGINASIICIETLFLAEYCGFGWVVGTFFWVFWFCFVIARKTKLKLWGFGLRRAAAEAAWKRAAPRPEPLRGGGQNPQSLSFVLRAITKKIKISEKSANYQPNSQYQPKKRLYLYNSTAHDSNEF